MTHRSKVGLPGTKTVQPFTGAVRGDALIRFSVEAPQKDVVEAAEPAHWEKGDGCDRSASSEAAVSVTPVTIRESASSTEVQP